jgi:ribonuclease HI
METVIVYTDGGSRGNPGPSAIGVAITSADGTKIKEYGEKLADELTNNEAEYEAVIFAMRKLKLLFGKAKTKELSVEFRMDSELIASQLAGEFKVEEERLQRLFMKIWNLRFDFGPITFRHVPREENTRADWLLNRALDAGEKTLF